jgi:CRP-like cAMP-binding protein
VVRPHPDQLTDVPLFASLTPEQREAIATLTQLRREAEGAQLVGEDAPGYALFVLQEGTAAVTSGGENIGELGPGDFFGEIALLGEGRRTATVTATSPVSLIVMHGSDFRVFERDWPEASQLMRSAMAERLGRSG